MRGASNQSASGPLILHWRAGGTTAPGHSGAATRSSGSQRKGRDGIKAQQQLDKTGDTERGGGGGEEEEEGKGEKPLDPPRNQRIVPLPD